MFTTVGLEQEVFAVKDPNPETDLALYSLAGTSYPQDGCPYLFELRGTPDSEPLRAIYNLRYLQNYWINKIAKVNAPFKLQFGLDKVKLSKAERLQLVREATKSPAEHYTLSGDIALSKLGVVTAGLHIHFSNNALKTFYGKDKEGNRVTITESVPQYIDIPRIVRMLDSAFKSEIKEAGRQLGVYEMKAHGFEYRSLPTSINLTQVNSILESIKTTK